MYEPQAQARGSWGCAIGAVAEQATKPTRDWAVFTQSGAGARRFVHVANLTIAIIFVAQTGCGVLNVPDLARQAVADWQDRTGETDPCRIDAMEHCVGASAAAAACGSTCAIRLGELLEQRQGDGNAMDRHNNKIGATRCGVPIGIADHDGGVDDSDAVGCCERSLNDPDAGLSVDGPCN